MVRCKSRKGQQLVAADLSGTGRPYQARGADRNETPVVASQASNAMGSLNAECVESGMRQTTPGVFAKKSSGKRMPEDLGKFSR
jgi:hypothetical protein